MSERTKKAWLQKTSWFCVCLAGDKCNHRWCSKVQVKAGQNEKDSEERGRLWGSLILLLVVTDSVGICILVPLEDA